jgi:putative membrane protein
VRRAIVKSAVALRVLGVLAAAVVAAGCAPMQGPAVQPAVVSAAPRGEPALLSQLAVNGLYELEVSRLAVNRATSPRVRTLAQTVASHRAQSRQQLVALMRSRGVPVPAQLPRDKAGKLQRLQALRPSHDFDAAYVRVVGVEDHEATIALLERARGQTRDAALASWIDRTLPVMRKDLQSAQQVAGQIAG